MQQKFPVNDDRFFVLRSNLYETIIIRQDGDSSTGRAPSKADQVKVVAEYLNIGLHGLTIELNFDEVRTREAHSRSQKD